MKIDVVGRFLRFGITLTAISVLFVVAAQKGGNDKWLIIAPDAADLTTGDPHLASGTQDRILVSMLFSGLVRYKPGDASQFEPDLAVSWQSNDDGTNWRFSLRDDALCHPWGNHEAYVLNADDVVYSLERAADPNRSAFASDYVGMKFGKLGDFEVEVQLDEPQSRALLFSKLADYAGGNIVCSRAAEELGSEFATHPVGTGPFMFTQYTPQQEVRLTANDGYFRGKPELNGVTVRYISNLASREAGLQTGELDIIEGSYEQVWLDRISDIAGLRVYAIAPGNAVVLHLDTTHPLMADVRYRKAIAYCLDRGELVDLIGPTVAKPLYSVVPPEQLGGLSEAAVRDSGLAYDVDRVAAEQLLAEVSRDQALVPVDIVITQHNSYLPAMQNIQDQLGRCGIDFRLRVVDHATFHTLVRQGARAAVLYVATRPTADAYLTQIFDSSAAIVTGINPNTNFSRYGTGDVTGDGVVDGIDALLDVARSSTDVDEQVAAWGEAQLAVLRDMVAKPLYELLAVWVTRDDVEFGYELNSTIATHPLIVEATHK